MVDVSDNKSDKSGMYSIKVSFAQSEIQKLDRDGIIQS